MPKYSHASKASCQSEHEFAFLHEKKILLFPSVIEKEKIRSLCGLKRLSQTTQILLDCTTFRKNNCREYYRYRVRNSCMAEIKGHSRRDTSTSPEGRGEYVCDVCMYVFVQNAHACVHLLITSVKLQYLWCVYLACCLLEQFEGSLSQLQMKTGV